jgi:hypothetical protein
MRVSPEANRNRIEKLRDRHRGEQCLVLCTGPSARSLDLTQLARHPNVMGVNGAYLLRNHFRYYFVSNPEFVNKNAQRISRVEAEHMLVRWCSLPDCLGAGVDPERLILFGGSLDEIGGDISTDLTRPLPRGPTVLLSIVLPTVVWCGFEEILLIGADFPSRGYSRFHTGVEAAPRQVRRGVEFYEREMEIGRLRARMWADYLRRHHPSVKVLNCSPASELDAFERADPADAIRLPG